ncbi:MAG: CCA tRNA nucleotidyltransferase [Ignavibacteria bacterium]|nr:CCA tRNA nucleotidyltransferase [Ignavibacteria bacterium]
MTTDFRDILLKDKLLCALIKFTEKSDYDVYLVGGYVRDALLGNLTDNHEMDIMVIGDAIKFASDFADSTDSYLKAVYKNFGTALLESGERKIELASSRTESYDRGSRKPAVESGTLKDDLSRRDFTINALAVELKHPENIIDIFNGCEDLKSKIIKTPLNPDVTFFDDPLRILRAIRFASTLGFSIEEHTLNAIRENRSRLKEDKVVSQERITSEFTKIILSSKPSVGLNLLFITGVLDVIFPEISELAGVDQRKDYHHKDVFYHTLQVVDNISAVTDDFWLRFAALTHDIAKPKTKKFVDGTGWTFHGHEELGARMMKKIFERMRLSLSKLEYIQKLIRLHLRPAALASETVTDSAIRRLAAESGEDLIDLFRLCRADITSKNPGKVTKYLANFDFIEKRIIEVQEKDNLRNFQSPVRGDEIMKICSINPSKLVGILKTSIEEAILEGIIPNEYGAALDYLYSVKDEIIKNYTNKY